MTTGFGKFADVAISRGDLEALQRNLVRSHAAGVGPPLEERAVRAMMVLRANALARGRSGRAHRDRRDPARDARRRPPPGRPRAGLRRRVRRSRAARAPRAGADRRGRGHRARPPAARARRRCGARASSRSRCEAKEGLALINGVQMSVAVGGLALRRAIELSRAADLVGAASLDASRGSDAAFDARIVAARPHPGRREDRREPARPAEGQRDPRVASRLRPRAGQLRAAVHAAGARRGARRVRARPAR